MTRLVPREPVAVAPGAVHLPEWLDLQGQRDLVSACTTWVAQAGGPRSPRMPRGGVMSVQITCLGWHWYPYRYSRTVDDGDGWRVAPFPDWLGHLSRRAVAAARALDSAVAGVEGEEFAGGAGDLACYQPDVALINWYGPGARMGMHADREEASLAPVVSLSVGDTCVFRFGTTASRGRPWRDVELESGDLFVFGGPSRRAFHGVPRVVSGTAPADLGLDGGRFNVTVRQTGLSG